MRPINLKMTAFGAYVKETSLDFEKGLGGANFFLINGATGAGKTTILDAICYALYGESSGGSRTSKMMRSEQAIPNDKTEVEFEFSLRGKTYKIRRSPAYSRPKLRGDGTTEEKATAEIYENGKFIETKDVSEYVKNLLGFDADQFRQVIVLPQGEFKNFLLAKSKDKQEVLNTLFNADFFRRVEDELKIKAAAAKNIFKNLTDRKENKLAEAECSEEELPALIKNLSEELDATQMKLKTLATEADEAQKNYGDGENLSKLFRDFDAKSEALANAENFLKQILGKLSAAKIEFDKRQAEETLRENLKILAADLAKKKDALKKLDDKKRELKDAEAAAEKSEAEVKRLKKFKLSCDETMAKRKLEIEKLRDAPAKLKVAEQNLKDAKERAKLLSEIENLRGKILSAEKELAAAKKSHEDAEKNLADLREAQKSGRAALLAADLIEGKPCPVCGAIHHPSPAISTIKIPTDAQIKDAESNLKTLADEKTSAEKILAGLKSELETKEKILSDGKNSLSVAQAQATFDELSAEVDALNKCNDSIKNGEVKIAETEENLAQAQAADKKNLGTAENLRGSVEELLKNVEEKYLTDKKLLDAEILSTNQQLDKLKSEFQTAQENFNRLSKRAAAQKATVESEQKNKAEVAAQIEGKILPDMNLLEKIRDETRAAHISAIEAKTKLSERIGRLKDIYKKISALNDDLTQAEKNFLMWKTLSEVANGHSASKISFQRYYLSTMFKEVISEANNRLEKMSGGRYRFQAKTEVTDKRYSGGLDMEIVDDYTGTARPVETLSGGESFLASLSLALGLAAVVQNNSGGIKLDTIFIDEGFGTLDSETLDFAMKTLIELQSGGRLVGIISHVEELKNQMPVRIEVTKNKTGSTAEFKGVC